jgi:hypothetical protein
MTDDREALVSEIQRLHKSRWRWRVTAIAALVLVFAALVPFTVTINHGLSFLENRNAERYRREENLFLDELTREIQRGIERQEEQVEPDRDEREHSK